MTAGRSDQRMCRQDRRMDVNVSPGRYALRRLRTSEVLRYVQSPNLRELQAYLRRFVIPSRVDFRWSYNLKGFKILMRNIWSIIVISQVAVYTSENPSGFQPLYSTFGQYTIKKKEISQESHLFSWFQHY